MTWTKLTEDFPQHPKILAAGERAELLHIHALIYCNHFLTDGFIPFEVVPTLTQLPKRQALACVQTLIKLGIWMPVEGGYQIHDFLEYQPSKAKVLAERRRKASAGQAGGLARARAVLTEGARSLHNPVPVPVPESVLFVPTGETVLNGKTATNGEAEQLPVVTAEQLSVMRQHWTRNRRRVNG